jgi:hypothetical protein
MWEPSCLALALMSTPPPVSAVVSWFNATRDTYVTSETLSADALTYGVSDVRAAYANQWLQWQVRARLLGLRVALHPFDSTAQQARLLVAVHGAPFLAWWCALSLTLLFLLACVVRHMRGTPDATWHVVDPDPPAAFTLADALMRNRTRGGARASHASHASRVARALAYVEAAALLASVAYAASALAPWIAPSAAVWNASLAALAATLGALAWFACMRALDASATLDAEWGQRVCDAACLVLACGVYAHIDALVASDARASVIHVDDTLRVATVLSVAMACFAAYAFASLVVDALTDVYVRGLVRAHIRDAYDALAVNACGDGTNTDARATTDRTPNAREFDALRRAVSHARVDLVAEPTSVLFGVSAPGAWAAPRTRESYIAQKLFNQMLRVRVASRPYDVARFALVCVRTCLLWCATACIWIAAWRVRGPLPPWSYTEDASAPHAWLTRYVVPTLLLACVAAALAHGARLACGDRCRRCYRRGRRRRTSESTVAGAFAEPTPVADVTASAPSHSPVDNRRRGGAGDDDDVHERVSLIAKKTKTKTKTTYHPTSLKPGEET